MKRWKIGWTLLVTTALIAAVLAIIHRQAHPSHDRLSLSYILEASITTEPLAQEGDPQLGSLLSGVTQSHVAIKADTRVDLIAENDTINAFFSFDSPEVTVASQADTEVFRSLLLQHLKQGFEARYARDGRFLNLVVPDSLPHALLELLWDMAHTLSALRPAPESDAELITLHAPRKILRERYVWTTTARDTLSKSLMEIDDIIKPSHQSLPFSTWNIVHSRGECVLAKDQRLFPEACASDHAVELYLKGQLILRGTKQFKFAKSTSKQAFAGLSLPHIPSDRPPLDLSPQAQRAQFRLRIAQNNAKDLVLQQEFHTFREHAHPTAEWKNEHRMAWAERIADYLLLHPEQVPELESLAKELGADHPYFSLIPYILSVSGNQESQTGLVNLATIFDDNASALYAILSSMLFLQEPTQETFDFLVQHRDKQRGLTSDVALLAIGKYSGHQDKLAPQAFTYVKERLAQSASDAERSVALMALGNGGHRQTIELVQPLKGAENPSLRASVANALRFVDHPERSRILFAYMRLDPAPEVRSTAAASLQYFELSPLLLADLQTLTRTEKDTSVRLEQTKSFVKFCYQLSDCVARLQSLRDKEPHGDIQKFLDAELQRAQRR